jgi:hypothetical protein
VLIQQKIKEDGAPEDRVWSSLQLKFQMVSGGYKESGENSEKGEGKSN